MNNVGERVYWSVVALVLTVGVLASVGYVAVFVVEMDLEPWVPAIAFWSILGLFPNFLLLILCLRAFAPLFDGRPELFSATSLALHAIALIATAWWFYRSRSLPLRRRATVLAVLLLVGVLGGVVAGAAMVDMWTRAMLKMLYGRAP